MLIFYQLTLTIDYIISITSNSCNNCKRLGSPSLPLHEQNYIIQAEKRNG